VAKAEKYVGVRVCSFCGKDEDHVRKLIAGPTVYICDECIDLCNDIIAEECDTEEVFGGDSPAGKDGSADGKESPVIGQEWEPIDLEGLEQSQRGIPPLTPYLTLLVIGAIIGFIVGVLIAHFAR
jgi:hypothetical protein